MGMDLQLTRMGSGHGFVREHIRQLGTDLWGHVRELGTDLYGSTYVIWAWICRV